jgi:hypothetical protein
MSRKIGVVKSYGAIDQSDLNFGSTARACHQLGEIY